MEEVYGVIYLITNLINGKKYVGQTKQIPRRRWNSHCHVTDNNKDMPIVRAIVKYKKENFTFQVIEKCSTWEKLNEREGYHIQDQSSLVSQGGYNLTTIIEGNRVFSEETLAKMSKRGKDLAKDPNFSSLMREMANKNRGIGHDNHSSSFVGVYLERQKIKLVTYTYWSASITFNYKHFKLGKYLLESDAAKAYDIKALELFGTECVLNFPELRDDYLTGNITLPKIRPKTTELPKGVCYTNKRYRVRLSGIKTKSFRNETDAVNYLNNPEPYIPKPKKVKTLPIGMCYVVKIERYQVRRKGVKCKVFKLFSDALKYLESFN